MAAAPSETAVRQHEAIDLLLGYLDAACWPGGDGLTVEDALHSYPQAAAAGLVPCREEVVRLHPELLDVLLDLLTHPPPSEP
jgi:hypothetical protein